MESRNGEEVNDKEVPLNGDNQSNNVEMSRREESPQISESEITDNQTMASNQSKEVTDSEQRFNESSTPVLKRHQYSKEQLIQISKLSSARMRPKCLDNAYNNSHNGLWNPEKWISSRSPAVNVSTSKHNLNKRVTNDLKDRIFDEENDIILSPQRGSFGTGCHVSSNNFGVNRNSNESRSRDHYNDRNKMDEQNESSHRSAINNRRVGSGRIVAKDRERSNDWNERNYDRMYEHRDSRDRCDDFNDRRSGRFERRPNREMNSNRNIRYENHRFREHKYSREEEDEPEWFTEPTTKHDTIELKGFDDDSELTNKDMTENKSKDETNKNIEFNNENQNNSELKAKDFKDLQKETKNEEVFDVNEMFKSENFFERSYDNTSDNKMVSSVVGISDNVNNEVDVNVKSRFKRWFNESPKQSVESNDSFNSESMHTKQNESLAPMMRPTNTQTTQNPMSPERIFELLSNGCNRMSFEQLTNQKLDPTKAMSLTEIEANISETDLNKCENKDNNRFIDKLMLSNKTVQNSNEERVRIHNVMKNETVLMQTMDAHFALPKSRNAPSILELLKEQENKEAILYDFQQRQIASNFPNGTNISQNSVNTMFGNFSQNNSGVNAMEATNWTNNSSPLMKIVRPTRVPSNQEMSEHTTNILHKALQNRQTGIPPTRPQTESFRSNTPNRNVSNFLIPTSVMRNMHSDKERDSLKSVFSEMSCESNSSPTTTTSTPTITTTSSTSTSQFKFFNENLISKPSPMRPIVKSNNPIGESVAAKQSPLPSQSAELIFSANNMSAIPSHLYHTQQMVGQNASLTNSHQNQRPLNSSNPSVRPFNLGQNPLNRTSTPPNLMNNIPINSNQHFLQMMAQNRQNLNQIQINQLMALQHNSSSEVRQSQFPHSRPNTATNVQQMLLAKDSFNSFNRNIMSESEVLKPSVQTMTTTYSVPSQASQTSQPRPQMQHLFQNSSASQPQPIRNNESLLFGQIFRSNGGDPMAMISHNMPELPTVPLHSALTLDDVERP